MSDTLRIMLVDDHAVVRMGFRLLLDTTKDLRVVAECGSGEEALQSFADVAPDVVVLDLSMEGMGGMEALRRILQFDRAARVLVYSVHVTDAMLSRALSLGALGYVTKASDTDVLVAGIREVAGRRGFVSPDLIHAMVHRHVVHEHSLLEQLSDKEFQILLLTAQGHQAEGCAQALNISAKTVRNHLTRIKAKLDVADTAGLILLAMRAGLVED